MLDEKKKWHSTKPSPFPNGLFFPPETNIAPGPQAFPKGSWIIFQPQGFFLSATVSWFQAAIFLRFSESVVDLNSIFPKLGPFVEPY